MIYNKGGYYSF